MKRRSIPARVPAPIALAAVLTACGTISVEDEKKLGAQAPGAAPQAAHLRADRSP